MSKVSKLIKPLLDRPKCFSHLYYPYTSVEICNCVDFCKYGPPPAVMKILPENSVFIKEKEEFCISLNNIYEDEKVA